MLLIWSYLFFSLGEVALQSASLLASQVGPRPVGTPEARRAADQVAKLLADCGLAPQRHTFTVIDAPGVEALGAHFLSPLEAHFDGQNIWARIGPAEAPALLVGAHYDSVSLQAPGARDNAAGVGVMVAAACALKDTWRGQHALVFVAFDGEEEHLLGSRAFLRDQPAGALSMVLALDVLGTDNLSLNGLSPLVGASLLSAALAAAEDAEISLSAPFAQLVISRFLPQGERSDHGPFTAAGLPAFQLYSRGAYGFDPYYHSPRDDAQRLDEESLDDAARWLVAFLPRADVSLIAGDDGRSFPVAGVLLPGWLVQGLLALSLLLAVAALLLCLRRRGAPRSVGRAFGALGVWAVASLLLSVGFLAPFWLGRVVQGVWLPWLSAISWYTLAGVLTMSAVALSLASSARLSAWRAEVRPLWGCSLLAQSAAVAALWWAGAPEAAAPLAAALGLLSLGGIFNGRGRFLCLLSALIGASLLSPWRYAEGVFAWTLGGSTWLYVFVLWVGVFIFGAAAQSARSAASSTPPKKTPRGLVIFGWLLALSACVGAYWRAPYNDEVPRRTLAQLVYQGRSAVLRVYPFYGERLDGLSLLRDGVPVPLAGAEAIVPLSAREEGLLSQDPAALADGTPAFLVGLAAQTTPFVAVKLSYLSTDAEGRPVSFSYRTEGGAWQEVTSPLGVRVGFFGALREIKDLRAFRLQPGASLKVSASAVLRAVPEEVSFVAQPHHLSEVAARLELQRTLIAP